MNKNLIALGIFVVFLGGLMNGNLTKDPSETEIDVNAGIIDMCGMSGGFPVGFLDDQSDVSHAEVEVCSSIITDVAYRGHIRSTSLTHTENVKSRENFAGIYDITNDDIAKFELKMDVNDLSNYGGDPTNPINPVLVATLELMSHGKYNLVGWKKISELKGQETATGIIRNGINPKLSNESVYLFRVSLYVVYMHTQRPTHDAYLLDISSPIAFHVKQNQK